VRIARDNAAALAQIRGNNECEITLTSKRPGIDSFGVQTLALLRGDHEDTARHEGDLLAPTLRALWFHRFMLGDGVGALEPLSAFLATVLVSRHDFLRFIGLTHRDARPWSVLGAIKEVGDRRETNPARGEYNASEQH
jgi:hypothetical protein